MNNTTKKNKNDKQAIKIQNLAKKLLEPCIDLVKNMNSAEQQFRNLSSELLAGFKNFATFWTTEKRSKDMVEIVSEFREGIFIECNFLTAPQAKTANSIKDMDILYKEDRPLFNFYTKCMKLNPSENEGGKHGLPPSRIAFIFSLINQIPKMINNGIYDSVNDIPNELGTVKADKIAMNKKLNEGKESENRAKAMKEPLAKSRINFENSISGFIDIVNFCHTVVIDENQRKQVSKINNALSRKVNNAKVSVNDILQEALSNYSADDLKGKYQLIKERSDSILHAEQQRREKLSSDIVDPKKPKQATS